MNKLSTARLLFSATLVISALSSVAADSDGSSNPRPVELEVVCTPSGTTGPGLAIIVNGLKKNSPYVEFVGSKRQRFPISVKDYAALIEQVEADGIWQIQHPPPVYDITCRIKGNPPSQLTGADVSRRRELDNRIRERFLKSAVIRKLLQRQGSA